MESANTTKLLKIMTTVVIFIVALFAPYFQSGENLISLSQIAVTDSNFMTISVLPVALLLIFTVLPVLLPESWSRTISDVMFLACGIWLLLAGTIGEKFGYSYSLYITPVALSFIAFGEFLYLSSIIFKEYTLSVEDIVEIGLFVGLAMVFDLSFLKFRVTAHGGSISFAMLPLMVLSLRKGFSKGLFGAGIVFGLINCLTDGYGIFTFPFDYFLGFGSVAVIGIFRKWIMREDAKIKPFGVIMLLVSCLLVMVIRTAASTASGMIFYQSNFVESLVYQLTYVPASVGLCTAVLLLLYKPLMLMERSFKKKMK